MVFLQVELSWAFNFFEFTSEAYQKASGKTKGVSLYYLMLRKN